MAEQLRKAARIDVVVAQALEVVVECVDCRRRKHARLAHPAAEHLSDVPRPRHQRLVAGEHTAHGATKPLRQTHRNGFERLCVRCEGGGDCAGGRLFSASRLQQLRAFDGGDSSVPQPRPVAVHRHRVPTLRVFDVDSDGANTLDVTKRQNLSAEMAICVLNADDARRRAVHVVGHDGLLQFVEIHRPVGQVLDEPGEDAPDGRNVPHLVERHVGVGAEHGLVHVPFVAVRHARGEVAHRRGREKQRLLFPEQRRDTRLERVHGRVLAEDVVANLGHRHRLAHPLGRLRHRVTPEVNDV
mmetsp:Transcript_10493/g.32590  ORF Transcript_10493/g.32590 Transcript_10493/m.32590 type:complete len:299 (-) Transcript_10493:41-937(-)